MFKMLILKRHRHYPLRLRKNGLPGRLLRAVAHPSSEAAIVRAGLMVMGAAVRVEVDGEAIFKDGGVSVRLNMKR
jgi:hypothetical protein